MTYEDEREFCYGEHVRIKDTAESRKNGIAGHRGSVVATFGPEITTGVVVYFGGDRTVAVPAELVVHC